MTLHTVVEKVGVLVCVCVSEEQSTAGAHAALTDYLGPIVFAEQCSYPEQALWAAKLRYQILLPYFPVGAVK